MSAHQRIDFKGLIYERGTASRYAAQILIAGEPSDDNSDQKRIDLTSFREGNTEQKLAAAQAEVDAIKIICVALISALGRNHDLDVGALAKTIEKTKATIDRRLSHEPESTSKKDRMAAALGDSLLGLQ